MKINATKRNFLVKLFVGFVLILSVVAAAFCFAPKTTKLAKADATATIEMGEGAAMRLTQDSGLRFWGYVSDTHFSDAENNVLKSGVTVGMDVSINVDGATTQTITSDDEGWKWATNDKDGWQKFQVAILYEDVDASYYATEVTATAFVTVDGTKTPAANPQTRSVAQVANAALTEEYFADLQGVELEQSLSDTQKGYIQGFVTTTSTGAIGNYTGYIAMENGDFTWNKVTDAKGYFVEYGDVIEHVADTGADTYSVAVSKFGATEGGVVTLLPYFNGVDATYSARVNTMTVIDVAGDMVNGITNGYVTNFNTAAANGMNAEAQATDDGVLVTTRANHTRQVIFGITLENGLDLTQDGMKVTFQIQMTSELTSRLDGEISDDAKTATEAVLPTLGLQLVGKDINKNYSAGSYRQAAVYDSENRTWAEVTLYLKSAELDVYYDAGDYHIGLGLISENANSGFPKSAILLKEISYCDQLATPANVAVDGATLSWDAVSGATGYTVYANGEVLENVDTTSFDLSDLTASADLQVRAYADGAISSELSEAVSYVYLADDTLASFDDASYVNNVSYCEGNRYFTGGDSGTWKAAPKYEVYEDGGVVDFSVCKDTYGSSSGTTTNLAAFSVTLSKALDLSKGGIEVYMYLYDGSLEENLTVCLLKNNDMSSWNSGATTPNVTMTEDTSKDVSGGWVTLQITAAELKALGYASGDTVLSFGVFGITKDAAWRGRSVQIKLDYVKYYNA